MKLTAKNRPTLIRLLLLGTLAGTLAWALFEALLTMGGFPLNLEAGPVGFDLYVVTFWLRVNPGSFLGLLGGGLLFRSI
jgi:hypothetical protein